jgi:23S rRNA (guanosine2251-2'-O)-methyltransferase
MKNKSRKGVTSGKHDKRQANRQKAADGEASRIRCAHSAVLDAPQIDSGSSQIYGRNPVVEAIEKGVHIDRILLQKNVEGAGKKIYALAKKAGILVQNVDRSALDRVSGTTAHQGVVAYVAGFAYCDVADIFAFAKEKGESPFIVVLDGIEDPHNLGAIIRSAEGAGVHGLIIPERRATPVTATVIKVSAGAAMHMRVARVGNLGITVDRLKAKGVWLYGLDMDGLDFHAQTYDGSAALVVGAEGRGLSRLLREKCDHIISIPMRGHIGSLNVSNAAAILLYEMRK